MKKIIILNLFFILIFIASGFGREIDLEGSSIEEVVKVGYVVDIQDCVDSFEASNIGKSFPVSGGVFAYVDLNGVVHFSNNPGSVYFYNPDYCEETDKIKCCRKVIFEKHDRKYMFFDFEYVDQLGVHTDVHIDGVFDAYFIYDSEDVLIYQSQSVLSDKLNKKLNKMIKDKISSALEAIKELVKTNKAFVMVANHGLEIKIVDKVIVKMSRKGKVFSVKVSDFDNLNIRSLKEGNEFYDQFIEFLEWVKDYSSNNPEIENLFNEI